MAKFNARCRLFNVRLVSIRSLWTPETMFRREKLQTPQYKVTIIVKKSHANWYEEPEFAPIIDACKQVHAAEMAHINPQALKWPVRDGDALNSEGKVVEWSKGFWTVILSSNSAPEVGCFVDGVPLPLPSPDINGRRLWEDGDRAIVDISVTKNANNPVAFKLYVNSVAFNAKDERISVGVPRASLSEMAADAQARGISVVGIHGMPGMPNEPQTRTPAPFAPPSAFAAPSAFSPPAFITSGLGAASPAFADPTFAPLPGAASTITSAPTGGVPFTPGPAQGQAGQAPTPPLYKMPNGQVVDSKGRPTTADGRFLIDDNIPF